MATISLLSQKIFKKTLLGFGDAKVAALGGAWLGIDGIQIAMSAAFIAAGFFSLIGRISQRLKPWQAFPFAPFICFSIQSVWILDKGQWLFL
ncbi:Prepilin peptidase [Prochlorococcus sp. MIT 0603]|nr:Prepilin peptidase [Prochlorococcus sp. MIT 0603]